MRNTKPRGPGRKSERQTMRNRRAAAAEARSREGPIFGFLTELSYAGSVNEK